MSHNSSTVKRPLMVGFSGPDGSGKSTQVKLLTAALEEDGLTVEAVHQFEPVTRSIRSVKHHLRSYLDRVQASVANSGTVAHDGSPVVSRQSGRGRGRRVVGSLAAAWIFSGGWWRARMHARRSTAVDCLILDRTFLDEIVRASWKFGTRSSLATALLRRLPEPTIVFWLEVPEEEGWTRKKDLNTTRLEYARKRSVIDDVMNDARLLWNVQKVDVAGRTPQDVGLEIHQRVRAMTNALQRVAR